MKAEYDVTTIQVDTISGAASSISEGDIFIYSCSGQLSSFEIDLISKELNCQEHEYMNMAPSLIELAAPLDTIIVYSYDRINWASVTVSRKTLRDLLLHFYSIKWFSAHFLAKIRTMLTN